jgi:hypothetical protein
MKTSTICTLLGILAIYPASVATAQINYSGGTYSEDFNTIFSSDGTGSTLTGVGTVGAQGAIPTLTTWRAARVGGTGTGGFALFADWGSSGTGRLYSYGPPAGSPILTERALGSVASATTIIGFGTYFINTSSSTFTDITLSFDREVWRNQAAVTDQSLFFAYGLSSSGISDTDFLTHSSMTPFSGLDATAPAALAGAGTQGVLHDGNAAPWKDSVSATITGLSWAPNQTLYIRWNDADDSLADAGISIDNLTMTALVVPEPGCGLLLGLGLAALAIRRRHAR